MAYRRSYKQRRQGGRRRASYRSSGRRSGGRSYRSGRQRSASGTLRIELVGAPAQGGIVPDRASQMATTPKRSMF